MLNNDKPESVVPYVAELLDKAGIRIIFWNGDLDLLCCHTGTDMLLDSMKWSKSSEWKNAERGVWMVNDRKAGYTKTVGNLTYVTVYNSGHMVYYNQPARCLDLVTRFIQGKSLFDVGLPSYPHPRDTEYSNFHSRFVAQVALGVVLGAALLWAWQRLSKDKEKRGNYERLANSGNTNYNTTS